MGRKTVADASRMRRRGIHEYVNSAAAVERVTLVDRAARKREIIGLLR